MPIDPRIPLSVFASAPDPMESYQRAMSLRELADRRKMNDIKMREDQIRLAELTRQQAEAAGVRKAQAGAVIPQQQATYQMPGVQVGGMDIGGGQMQTVSTPARFDRSAMRSNLAADQSLAHLVPQYEQQWAQQEAADAKAKHDAAMAKLTELFQSGQVDEQKRKMLTDAGGMVARGAGAVKMAKPEDRPMVYASVIQSLSANAKDNPALAHILENAPKQYTPEVDHQLDGWIAQGMGIEDIGKRVFPLPKKQTPGVDIPFPKDVADQKVQIAKASRPVVADGAGLEDAAVDQAAQLYLQTGQMPSLGMGSAAAGLRTKIMNRAAHLNAGADIAQNKLEYGGKRSTTTYFTSGAGGKQLTAFNTAITHLDTLDRLAGDLQNGNMQVFNRASQAWSEATGNPAPANFAAAVNAMSGEVAAALKASGATDQEIAHVSSTFSRAQSPAQLKGAIGTYRELLKSKAQQLQKQYDSGMKGKPAFNSQDPGGAGVSNIHVNPQTGEKVGWDGKAWVRVQ